MPTIASQLHAAFATAIQVAFDIDADPLIGLSQNAQFGDYQSNAAMGLSKIVTEKTGQKMNPRQVAEQIKAKLNLGEIASDVTIAGPGFINVKLNPAWLSGQVNAVAVDPTAAVPKTQTPQTVLIDYSGVNIAKEMHVGHLRSTIIGDAIANVIEQLGNTAVRRNHLGDWGTQFGMLITKLMETGPVEAISILDLEKFYRDAKASFDSSTDFQSRARQNVVNLQAGDAKTIHAWKQIVEITRRHYQPIYEWLGVRLRQEHERGESFYNPYLPGIVKELREKNLAIESDGAIAVFVDGPDRTPLIIQKSDGGYLYGTTDLAAIKFRIEQEHADRIIYTHDSRQAQHFSQVFRTADQAGWTRNGQVKLEYAPFGTMLGEDGKPFKTRSGDVVKLKDLLDEAEERALAVVNQKNPELPDDQRKQIAHAIGIGAVKYADLSKDRTSDYVFKWDSMLAFEGNTAPYLQYVYARIQSIFRKAGLTQPPAGGIELQALHELSLAKHILRFGEVVELVAKELKPHLLCTYLFELAQKFSAFYENCPVLSSEEPTRSSRLALCNVTASTMGAGLDLLGIEHPDQM